MNNDSMNTEFAQYSLEKSRFYSGLKAGANGRGRLPPLQSVPPKHASTTEELRDLAERIWRQRGLALFDPLTIADDSAREALLSEANRLYGRRASPSLQMEGV